MNMPSNACVAIENCFIFSLIGELSDLTRELVQVHVLYVCTVCAGSLQLKLNGGFTDSSKRNCCLKKTLEQKKHLYSLTSFHIQSDPKEADRDNKKDWSSNERGFDNRKVTELNAEDRRAH